MAQQRALTAATSTGYTMTVRGLTKRYVTPGGVQVSALEGVDLDLPSGSVTACLGPSGSGKSTLLHVLGGMDRADSGSITADEREVTKLSTSGLVSYRRTVGFVFQSFALLPAMTAKDNVLLPVVPYRETRSWRNERADELLADVGLATREQALPSQLSGGQRQRVAIARALMNSPRLLLADEPTGNLDSSTGEEIMNRILQLRDERGITIVLATHDGEVAARCDRVIRLHDGRLQDAA